MADPRVSSGTFLTLPPGSESEPSPGPGRDVVYVEAIREALHEEMAKDPRVLVLGEDVGTYGGAFRVTEGLLSRFGEGRVVDTPVSEEAIVGAAIGAAIRGLRPVAEMQFIDFVARAFDLLTNFAAKSRYRTGVGVPMVVRGPSGAGVHGGPFHSQSPEMHFVKTPGLKVVVPATAYDAKGLLKAAIRDEDPVVYLEHKFLYRRVKDRVPDADYVVPIGKACVRRPGRDLTIVTYGAMLWPVLEAAGLLSREEGLEAEVIDLRTLSPLDEETVVASVRRTSRCLVVHEDTRTGGLAGELTAVLFERAFEWLDAPVARLTAPDTPIPFSPVLEKAFLPDAPRVAAAARRLARY